MTTIWEVDDADEEIEGLDAAGRPDPAYAAALGLIRAPYGRRFLAVTIDVVIYLIVQIPYWAFSVPLLLMFARSEITLYGLVAHPNFFVAVLIAGITALLTLALLIVQGVFQGRVGVTIGKAITGIRSINVVRLAKPGFWRIVLRTLIVGASNIVPVIGPTLMFFSALGDSEQRGRAWHDHATQVWLIDVKKGLDPYDGKRMRIARKVVKVEIAPQTRDLPSLATAESSGAEPEYRPAHSVSAGVLGVAKSRRAGRDDSVGIVAKHLGPASTVTAVEKEGAAVVGGYRADRSGQAPLLATGLPPRAPEDHRVVLGVPPEIASGSAPRTPSAPAPEPPAPAPQTPPAAAPEPAVRLALDSGDTYVFAEPMIFGRNPDETGSFGAAQRVAVSDDTRSVSKTHFAIRRSASGIEVQDLGSTNGTFILRGGVETQVPSGAALIAAPGDVVRFGDRTMAIGTV
ncbi:RDD family protein [Microbacterium sp. A196]|uniref:RDD family protein n=1 Tax=unclassified Microbacterium TaxID=2609290 RepID=UPI003FD056A3